MGDPTTFTVNNASASKLLFIVVECTEGVHLNVWYSGTAGSVSMAAVIFFSASVFLPTRLWCTACVCVGGEGKRAYVTRWYMFECV